MDDKTVLRSGELLIAAMGMLPRDVRWPLDNSVFARTVDVATLQGNAYASKFYVTDGVSSRRCPEYEQLLNAMLRMGLIMYLPPEFNTYVVNVGTHGAAALRRRNDATAEEVKQTDEFLALFEKEAAMLP